MTAIRIFLVLVILLTPSCVRVGLTESELQQQDCAEFLQAALRIDDGALRDLAMLKISHVICLSGPCSLRELLDRISLTQDKVFASIIVADRFRAVGNLAMASETLDMALLISDRVRGIEKANVISHIAAAYARCGNTPLATSLAAQLPSTEMRLALLDIAKEPASEWSEKVKGMLSTLCTAEQELLLRQLVARHLQTNDVDGAITIANYGPAINRDTRYGIISNYLGESNRFTHARSVINLMESADQKLRHRAYLVRLALRNRDKMTARALLRDFAVIEESRHSADKETAQSHLVMLCAMYGVLFGDDPLVLPPSDGTLAEFRSPIAVARLAFAELAKGRRDLASKTLSRLESAYRGHVVTLVVREVATIQVWDLAMQFGSLVETPLRSALTLWEVCSAMIAAREYELVKKPLDALFELVKDLSLDGDMSDQSSSSYMKLRFLSDLACGYAAIQDFTKCSQVLTQLSSDYGGFYLAHAAFEAGERVGTTTAKTRLQMKECFRDSIGGLFFVIAADKGRVLSAR